MGRVQFRRMFSGWTIIRNKRTDSQQYKTPAGTHRYPLQNQKRGIKRPSVWTTIGVAACHYRFLR